MAKARTTFLIPEELAAEVRDAVAFLAGPPLHLTMAQLAEEALREKLDRLKAAHNKGRAFPKYTGRPKVGRPVGS